jgi:hypothetical protein
MVQEDERQDCLWETLQHRPQLACNIRTLRFKWSYVKYVQSPPFEKRLEYILRHTCSLNHVELDLSHLSAKDRQMFCAVLTSLARLRTKPMISFLDMPSHCFEPALAIRDLVLNFKDELKVIKLEICGSQVDLQYVAKFHQLERLNVYASSECQDLYRFLSGIPLIKLTVIVQNNELISSFPLNLRILKLYLCPSTLFHVTWTVVCGLKYLDELVIDCETVEGGPPCRFESSNLRLFQLAVDDESDMTVVRQIISPIVKDCRRLSVVQFHLVSLSSAILSSIIPRSYALSSLEVITRSSSYAFQNLINGAENISRVRNIKLPWPKGSRDDEVSERLTMEQAQHLAVAWRKLDEIEFRLTDSKQNQYWMWSGVDSFPLKVSPNMPFNQRERGLEFWRRSQYALLQTFKMAKLMDESSPCLNLCTVFFHFGDENYPDTQGEYGQKIVTFLSLNQVRRHDGHL